MFILPPPPRSTTSFPLNAVLEATNSYTDLTAPPQNGFQSFTAPEGQYKAREVVFLATPLPHPSDPPPTVINPLAPTNNQPQAHGNGVKMTVITMQDSQLAGHLGHQTAAVAAHQPSRKNSTSKWTFSLSKKADDESNGNGNGNGGPSPIPEDGLYLSSSAPAQSFLSPGMEMLTRKDSAPAPLTLSTTGLSTTSRRKPKSSLAKNNSSFISRCVVHDNLQKRLGERGVSDLMLFANVGRSISWVDLSPVNVQKHDPLMKVLFTKAHPLCHDVNQHTKSMHNLDVITGTSAGDLIWMECMTAKYNRINKNGDVTRSAVIDVAWVPGSDNLFVSAHADGSLVLFDRDRDDGAAAAAAASATTTTTTTTSAGQPGQPGQSNQSGLFKIIKSMYDTSTPTSNPVARYKVSNSPITSIKFGTDGSTLAITNKDGYLRLLNLAREELTDVFPSYYGGFLCCTFSPDGKYLATGGQDDMLVIWSLERKQLVARCQGHGSWVRAVAFDPVCSDQTNYRLGSVGDDGRLLLWDFNPRSLTRPKTAKDLHPPQDLYQGRTVKHPFVSQSDVAVLIPVVTKLIKLVAAEPECLSDIAFCDDQVLVMGKDGRCWVWDRPN